MISSNLLFNRQPVLKRIAIAAAGPIANFVFAIFAYWLVFSAGTQVLVPVIGHVDTSSPAAEAGLTSGMEFVSIDGVKTPDWGEVAIQLFKRAGDTGSIQVEAKLEGRTGRLYDVNVDDWLADEVQPDPLKEMGVEPFRVKVPPVFTEIVPDSPASNSGFLQGDRVVAINGAEVQDSHAFIKRVQVAINETLTLTVVREDRELDIQVTPEVEVDNGKSIALIGVMLETGRYPDEMIREVEYGILGSLQEAMIETADMSLFILTTLKKMVLGDISVKNLGGPITIANAAETSASYGVKSFIVFLAQLSISLGVLNLLPIPVLDGGHLLFYFIELARGKALSEEKQALGVKIGVILIAFVMLFAFYNDLSRI